ncbi:hypothetical protein ACWKSP_36670 [Micromonosporaceae bacterium Da 78-11]
MSRSEPGRRPTVRGEPTLVRDVDLRDGLPCFDGAVVRRVWLLLRFGDTVLGDLVLAVPESGLTPPEVGAAVAARFGNPSRPAAGRPGPTSDSEPRPRRRGGM